MLLQLALGDHQVANITAEVEARTIGASVYTPALEPGRHWEADPFMGIPEVVADRRDPVHGRRSMMVYYDGGPVTWTQPGQQPARAPARRRTRTCRRGAEWGYGDDPHGYPRASRRTAANTPRNGCSRRRQCRLRGPGRLLLRQRLDRRSLTRAAIRLPIRFRCQRPEDFERSVRSASLSHVEVALSSRVLRVLVPAFCAMRQRTR